MVHRLLQCLVRWRSWQINKILWTYKRKEDRKREESFQECKNCAKLFRAGPRKMIAPLLLLLLLCHLKLKPEPCSPLQLPHTGRLVVVLSFISAISPDRKLLPDEQTESQEVTASHRKPMFRGVTLPRRDVFLYNLVIFESVTSPCNDDYEVAARDAKYTLHFQTQGQGDIQTTGTFYTGIFITSSKACKGNEGVLRGGGSWLW